MEVFLNLNDLQLLADIHEPERLMLDLAAAPDDHRALWPVDGPERRVREKHSAITLRDAPNPVVIISPIKTESEHILSTWLTGISGTACGKWVNIGPPVSWRMQGDLSESSAATALLDAAAAREYHAICPSRVHFSSHVLHSWASGEFPPTSVAVRLSWAGQFTRGPFSRRLRRAHVLRPAADTGARMGWPGNGAGAIGWDPGIPRARERDAPTLIRLLAAPAAPASHPAAILGLVLLTAFALWIAGRAVRRMEISYGAEP